ncbi:MAG: response regulator [Armatimonadota bacterium]
MPARLVIAFRTILVVVLIIAIVMIIIRKRYPEWGGSSKSLVGYWVQTFKNFGLYIKNERQRARYMKRIKGADILVIDSDMKSRKVIEWTLKDLGANVSLVRSGIVGIDKIKTKKYDVIIADALLSDVSPFDIKAEAGDVPLVLIGVLEEQVMDLMKLGKGYALVQEPYDPEDAAVAAGKLLSN